MESIPVADAARSLSISSVAAYEAMHAGRLAQLPGSAPARVSLASVQRLATERRTEALRRRGDLSALARSVDATLHPPADADGRVSFTGRVVGRRALRLLPTDAFAIFGRDVLEAAASRNKLRKGGGCPTCWARMGAAVHGTRAPRDDEAHRVLLGEACTADRGAWAAEAAARRRELDRLRLAENAKRQQAEQDRAAAEFSAAQDAARTAAQRLRTATQGYAPLNPAVVASATTQARQRGAFRAASKWPAGCDCDATHQCAKHAVIDAQARPFRRTGR
ncbi:hypothetical protein [Streptomyces sp. NPDC058371]|uniref:hypothetical protein n=1 Tax=Streptomyces sp. NPDC058371 TaxID=3346463 RepID=UPI00364A0534